jgi:hypothetical protein
MTLSIHPLAARAVGKILPALPSPRRAARRRLAALAARGHAEAAATLAQVAALTAAVAAAVRWLPPKPVAAARRRPGKPLTVWAARTRARRHAPRGQQTRAAQDLFALREHYRTLARLLRCERPAGPPEPLARRHQARVETLAKAAFAAAGLRQPSGELHIVVAQAGMPTHAVEHQTVKRFDLLTSRQQRHGWHAPTEVELRLHMAHDWLTGVHRRGLAAIGGGALVLEARPIADGCPAVYRARWVTQGRGYGVVEHRGLLAYAQGVAAFHVISPASSAHELLAAHAEVRHAWARAARKASIDPR